MKKSPIWMLFVIPVLMFGFGYLMVPLYDVFCDVTGINGKTGVISEADAANTEAAKNRWVKVEFLAGVNQNAPWNFRPTTPSMMIHPGQPYTTSYIAQNNLDRALVSQAVPSVAPSKAAIHFNKTECFCFSRQEFKPSEERELGLTFIVDPKLPGDVNTVTLSYTLFDVTESTN